MKKISIVLTLALVSVVLIWCTKKQPAATDTTNTPPANQEQPADSDNTAPNTDNNNVVESGDVVKVDYVGTTDDGEVFDTSIESVAQEAWLFNELRNYAPLEFTVGQGQMIPGFEKGVVGMKLNEKKTITIPPEEAYGEVNQELVQTLPASNFDEAGIEPEVWETYNFGIAQGTILEKDEETVTVDFNHPLAGKTLTFDVTLKEIISSEIVNAPEETAE